MKNYYERLEKIRQEYPELTFKNDGYEYLSPEVKEKHKEQIDEIDIILKETIPGFDRFDNFFPHRDGTFSVRFQSDYNHDSDYVPFIGVGYLSLELFKEES